MEFIPLSYIFNDQRRGAVSMKQYFKSSKVFIRVIFLLLKADTCMYATDDAVKWFYIKVYFVNIQLKKSQRSYFSL